MEQEQIQTNADCIVISELENEQNKNAQTITITNVEVATIDSKSYVLLPLSEMVKVQSGPSEMSYTFVDFEKNEQENLLVIQYAKIQPGMNLKSFTFPYLPLLTRGNRRISVEELRQFELRKFIPLMMSQIDNTRKITWNNLQCKPDWWPSDVPWANVRTDVRTPSEKKREKYSDMLIRIIKSCYSYYKREDLLIGFPKPLKVKKIKKVKNQSGVRQKRKRPKKPLETKITVEDTPKKELITLDDIETFLLDPEKTPFEIFCQNNILDNVSNQNFTNQNDNGNNENPFDAMDCMLSDGTLSDENSILSNNNVSLNDIANNEDNPLENELQSLNHSYDSFSDKLLQNLNNSFESEAFETVTPNDENNFLIDFDLILMLDKLTDDEYDPFKT